MQTSDKNASFNFAFAAPAGASIRGVHSPDNAPIPQDFAAALSLRHAEWQTKIRSRPGGFDGDRAVLTGWSCDAEGIQLRTAYRTYTQGRALRDVLVEASQQGHGGLLESLEVSPAWSWGLALACVVVLPGELLLCCQRSANMAVNAGAWTCMNTEIVEPSDIHADGMDALLHRLVAEELPSLTHQGRHRFVGLGRWSDDGGWALVSVLDLRKVSSVKEQLSLLTPDHETSAWAVAPLDPLAKPPSDTHSMPLLAAPALHWALIEAMRAAKVFEVTASP